MARARNIKPSFFQNEELGELSPLTRLTFIGMWTIADFKGCLEFRPKRLKVQLMPYDDCDFEVIASDLDKSGLIAIYTVAGQRYIKIRNFEKHQNPHKNERDAGSDIPDYSEEFRTGAASSDIEKNREENGTAPADSLFPLPDSGLLNGRAEPPSDSTPPTAVIAMPVTGGKEFAILQSHVDEWSEAYPAVDVIRQLAAMRQWCLANPTRRKTARGVLNFCNTWLAKEQNKPRPQAGQASTGGAWWASEQSVLAKGAELGMRPLAGESMQTFKGKVQAAIDNGGVPPAPQRSAVTGPVMEDGPRRFKPADVPPLASLVKSASAV